MTDKDNSAKLIAEILGNQTDVAVKELNIGFQNDQRIIIEVLDPLKIKNWEYFNYKLWQVAPEIMVHKEGALITYKFNNVRTSADRQLFHFANCLDHRYFEIVKPTVRVLNVIFKATNRCNLDCKFCYDKPAREALKHIKHIDLDSVDHFFKLTRDYTEELNLIWHGGEPLLCGMEFYEKVYEEILPKYPQLKVKSSIQTNATLLTEEWLKMFDKYGISVGSSYQVNWKLRGETTKGETVESVDKDTVLEKIDMAKKHGARVGVIDVITTDDLDHIIDKYEFYKKREMDFCFNEIFEGGAAKGANLAFNSKDEIKRFVDAATKYFRYWVFDKEGVDDRFAAQYLHVIGKAGLHTCYFGECLGQYICLNSSGDAYHCDRPYMNKYRIGNINDFKSLNEFYASPVFKMFAEERQTKYDTYCNKCDISLYCKGYCPLIDIDKFGTAAKTDPVKCAIRRGLLTSMFNILCEIKDINDVNPEVSNWVRQYNRFLPYEILKISEELNIPGVKEAFEENPKNIFKSKKHAIFRAFNTNAENFTAQIVLPLYKENTEYEHVRLSDEERYEVLKHTMKTFAEQQKQMLLKKEGFENEEKL